jgi:prevent-host-death family protein
VKKASITDAKNNLSALIDGLKSGSPVLIVDRGRPVARLEPVTIGTRVDEDGRLSRLVRDGVVRPARGTVPSAIAATRPPRAKRDISAVDLLIDERRSGR